MNSVELMHIHYSITLKTKLWYSYSVFGHIMVIQNYSYAVFNSHRPSGIQYSIQYSPNQDTRYSVFNSVCCLTFRRVFSMQCGIQWIVILASKLQTSWAIALNPWFDEYKWMGSLIPPSPLNNPRFFSPFYFCMRGFQILMPQFL